jgi:NADH:ubiquinone oxidoreductase subunit 3 (subunit A)
MSLPIEGSLNYFSILVLMIIALIVTSAIVLINQLMGKRPVATTAKKYETYESGVTPVGDAHQQFSVRYCSVILPWQLAGITSLLTLLTPLIFQLILLL